MHATTAELSRRIERVAAEYLLQRYTGPGNPMQTRVLDLGDAFATKVPFLPANRLMNCVHGLDDPRLLPDVLAFYAETPQPCWIEVLPYTPAELTRALVRERFCIDAYSSALVAAPIPEARFDPRDGVCVEEIAAAALDEFLDTLNRGFDSPPDALPVLRRNQRFWPGMTNWHLFLATVDGVPGGAAVLSVHDDVAYLAAGSVLPPFRGRGLHAALIAARIEKARARQCRVVCGNAEWGSQSQRNQQRAGLVIAHVRSVWTNRPSPSA